MLDAGSQHIARAPHNSVDCVTLLQEQLGQVRAILTSDSGNQRDFIGIFPSSSVTHPQTLRPNFFSSSASEI
jgi:hypothetical protein